MLPDLKTYFNCATGLVLFLGGCVEKPSPCQQALESFEEAKYLQGLGKSSHAGKEMTAQQMSHRENLERFVEQTKALKDEACNIDSTEEKQTVE